MGYAGLPLSNCLTALYLWLGGCLLQNRENNARAGARGEIAGVKGYTGILDYGFQSLL
jgi:hypothetical protein